jgi:hypothetical protein
MAVASLAIDEKIAANTSANNRNNELGLIAGITWALGTYIKKVPLGCRPWGLLLFAGL